MTNDKGPRDPKQPIGSASRPTSAMTDKERGGNRNRTAEKT